MFNKWSETYFKKMKHLSNNYAPKKLLSQRNTQFMPM